MKSEELRWVGKANHSMMQPKAATEIIHYSLFMIHSTQKGKLLCVTRFTLKVQRSTT